MTVPSVPPPAGIPRPLVLQIRPDWTFLAGTSELLGPQGVRSAPLAELPAGSVVRPAVPDLAECESAALDESERELQRFLHIILPESVSPESWLEAVRRWPGVASVCVAPQCELPGFPDVPRP